MIIASIEKIRITESSSVLFPRLCFCETEEEIAKKKKEIESKLYESAFIELIDFSDCYENDEAKDFIESTEKLLEKMNGLLELKIISAAMETKFGKLDGGIINDESI